MTGPLDALPRRLARVGTTRWTILAAALALAACSGVPVPPAYTQEELATRCWRTGGWWRAERPDSLISGHCEYRD
jgi:hypothetical protein